MTISIITINYRSKEYLKRYLSSIYTNLISQSGDKYQFEVLIINNDHQSLELDFPIAFEPTIINHNENVGFGAANNIAARHAAGEFLFFLNPDIEIPDNSLLQMFDYFTEHPEIGIIGPKILLSETNQPQPWTCGNKISLCEIMFKNSRQKTWNKNEITPVDWVTGTALLIRKNDFLSNGGFDEKFFMYFEDQDLCLRVKAMDKKIVFFPKANVIHFDGKSWNDFKTKKTSFYVSQDYFFLKHHGKIKTWILKLLRLPLMIMLKVK